MSMPSQLFEHSPIEFTQAYRNTSSPLTMNTKAKLDKAQARRLKMPKRNRSAYFLFSMDVRAKLKLEQNQHLTPLETQAKVSQYWRELSQEEKEKYEARAKEEKLDYLVAMEKFYSNLTPETIAKSKSNRPKKPCSAYAHFVRDVKISLKKENPKLIMQEVLHIVSEKWKNIDPQTRQVYEEKAKADKKQYMLETRKLGSDSGDSPNFRKFSNQTDEGFGKRALDFDAIYNDEIMNKQVKTEALFTKSEPSRTVTETLYKPVKIEEVKAISQNSTSPMTTRSGSETGLELSERLKNTLMFKPEYMVNNMDAALAQARLTALGAPQVNQLAQLNQLNQINQNQNMLVNNVFAGNVNNNLLATLQMAQAAQANRELEDAIMRKIIEVKTLQNQRMLFARNMFMQQPNNNY